MEPIQYLGEHAGLSVAGKLVTILSFTAALFSAIAYGFANYRKDETSWLQLARTSFGIHAFSVIGIFGLLYYLLYNHFFEFYYVWFHSSTTLPVQYIFSCFWEGQEGSFLLWSFWHVVLAVLVIWRSGKWEAPVMITVMLVQAFLASMIIGVWIGDLHLGSNPFVLLREHPDMQNAPFIKMPDYLERISDGRGLNPLLQNYWMTIHPPVLFLGFASTLIPFAFAIAGLLNGKLTEWVRPAIPYTFFSIMIFGTGILMGAAWAYEALSFGGFWAWDPVENSSLVPWIITVGAGHVMLIVNRTSHGILTAFILTVLSFLLVLYSTFLTRSGILGDSSVHAFTDLGMQGQLLIYMLFFVLLAVVLLIINRKKLPLSKEEESMTSREFWIFIGALVLVISAIQIIATTSIPVINKMFDLKLAPPVDLIGHYNKWQVPIASIICLIIGFGQFLKYKRTDLKLFYKRIAVSALIAAVVTILYQWYIQLNYLQHVLLLFSALFACIANLNYFILVLKGRLGHSGASIAHAGIALILIGALVSNAKSTVISKNRLAVNLGKELPNDENIMLRKGDTLQMGNYFVTYKGRVREGINILYEVEYFRLNKENGKLELQFSLKPRIQLNERMGNAAEPDTRHFLDRDIYTHITYAEIEKNDQHADDEYQEPRNEKLEQGDTITTSNALLIFEKLEAGIDSTESKNTIMVRAFLKAIDVNMNEHYTTTDYIIEHNVARTVPGVIDSLGLKFVFNQILTSENKIELAVYEKKSNKREFIVMKAIVFPHINVLWSGCLLLIIGTVIAVRKRMVENRRWESRKQNIN